MKVLIDLNVLLDVLQKREPHCRASGAVLSRMLSGDVTLVMPGHAVTTLYYVIAKFAGRPKADDAIDWMLDRFEIAACTRETFTRARQANFEDYEDAVVACLAQQEGCEAIVTRNVADFATSPVRAVSPEEFLGDSPRT